MVIWCDPYIKYSPAFRRNRNFTEGRNLISTSSNIKVVAFIMCRVIEWFILKLN